MSHLFRCLALFLLPLAAEAAEPVALAIPEGASRADVRLMGPDGAVLNRHFENARAVLEGPQAWLGATPADGLYRYEIQFGQTLPENQRTAVAQARKAGNTGAIEGMPDPLASANGSFRVVDGRVQAASAEEAATSGASQPKSATVPNDQVIPDDLIVQGNICAGFDCVNNEAFGDDDLRLKANNTRLAFIDTSTGSFASDDWQLTANDQASGGPNKFSIENLTAATVPFTVEGAAPSNSLYVDPSGDVGLGTAVPALELQITDTDTPTVRLEQTGAGGFTPQTWDVAGNEANFFVRDVTNGSLLSFRIRPGAPSSSIDIAANGNVGIGTDSPQARLHVNGDAYVAGTLTQLSSRSAKTNLLAVASDAVLDQLSRLPLWTWNYLSRDADDRHIGPVAEDFYATFGFGTSAKQLAPSDVAGVALAASQALQREIAERDRTIATLEQRLARLEKLMLEKDGGHNASTPAN